MAMGMIIAMTMTMTMTMIITITLTPIITAAIPQPNQKKIYLR